MFIESTVHCLEHCETMNNFKEFLIIEVASLFEYKKVENCWKFFHKNHELFDHFFLFCFRQSKPKI